MQTLAARHSFGQGSRQQQYSTPVLDGPKRVATDHGSKFVDAEDFGSSMCSDPLYRCVIGSRSPLALVPLLRPAIPCRYLSVRLRLSVPRVHQAEFRSLQTRSHQSRNRASCILGLFPHRAGQTLGGSLLLVAKTQSCRERSTTRNSPERVSRIRLQSTKHLFPRKPPATNLPIVVCKKL